MQGRSGNEYKEFVMADLSVKIGGLKLKNPHREHSDMVWSLPTLYLSTVLVAS